MPSKEPTVPSHSFIVNDKRVNVQCADDVRLLWVLRDLLGIHGPKYGCGLRVCRACTCHINGKAFNPCSVPVSQIKHDDHITTIEGLAATVGQDLHPMQEAWIEHDVAQCGYCQPGQIMTAVALVKQKRAQGHTITEADLDQIRNICRCGTYARIRDAIMAGEAAMHVPEQKPKAKAKPKHPKPKHPKPKHTHDVHAASQTG
jgi:isoquinoline 1-oxidoreductase alpha subunit